MFKSKNPPREADCTTIIARGVRVVGDVHFTGNLHLEGTVEGSISAEDGSSALFTLNSCGRVDGQVRVPSAVIDGEVEGGIFCSTRLELAPGARINGDVHYKVLQMAAGATVNGRMIHAADAPPRLTQMHDDDAPALADAGDAQAAGA